MVRFRLFRNCIQCKRANGLPFRYAISNRVVVPIKLKSKHKRLKRTGRNKNITKRFSLTQVDKISN